MNPKSRLCKKNNPPKGILEGILREFLRDIFAISYVKHIKSHSGRSFHMKL